MIDAEESDGFVAVVGMAGRYPESPTLDDFWDNLRAGRDCLHTFTDDELTELGIPLELVHVDNFVPRGTRLPDRDAFDARFFGYTPKQAAITDPQARIFLETCYEALENAGYDPFGTDDPVGVFAGSNPNDYALLLGVADPTDSLGAFDQLIGVDRDFVATRVSHKLGLTGPAMTIQTACSTSLVTVHAAVQSLLGYECTMALAGGVSINLRQGIGYFYQPGMILSPTGECRAFDARAEGTTLGQGCGVVVLKRLAEARADGDRILAVVRGTAINNDGSNKIGYTAPSEDGQVEVISTAQAVAGVESDSIGYIETHGTGTLLGDPIEIAALTRAFRPGTDRTRYCAIGSAKTNFGHTDAAAGITGFIKAVLTLHHGEIPPSLHFEEPNPVIDFENSPFFVNTELRPFPSGPTPRRAGVSAFGIGGTNAHVVLEEYVETREDAEVTEAADAPSPSDEDPAPGRPSVLVLSGRSAAAADRRVTDLASALEGDDTPPLAAVDFTLRHGRPAFEHRRAVVVGADRPLAETVAGSNDGTVVRGDTAELGLVEAVDTNPVWMFAGQGAQYPGMGAGLHAREPVFREAIDRVAEHLAEPLGVDLRDLLFPSADEDDAEVAERLRQTSMTQPALFAVEHAMATLLHSWGLQPRAVIGHSIGEYAGAVVAGILSWDAAATVVAERGRLMQSMKPGSMLSASISSDELLAHLTPGAELAADNSTALSVASGPTEVIEDLAAKLEAEGVSAQILHTSHAFHSAMMDEAVEQFADVLATVELRPPTIPLISNVTGMAISDDEAVDPRFWARQIRRPVRFTECLGSVVATGPSVFLELGPGRALSTFASAYTAPPGEPKHPVLAVPTMRHPRQDRDDQIVVLEAMGRLWTVGVDIDFDRINGRPEQRRVALPTYPFERVEAWLPAHRHVLALPHFGLPTADVRNVARKSLDQWLYVPSWRRSPVGDPTEPAGTTVVLAPLGEPGDDLVAQLRNAGHDVVDVRPQPSGHAASNERQLIDLFAELLDRETPVTAVVHAWSAAPDRPFDTLSELEDRLDGGVHSVLACARGLSALSRRGPVRLDIVTAGAFSVLGTETIRPDAAALLGPARVVPLEYSGITTRLIDLPVGLDFDADRADLVKELGAAGPELGPDDVIALRGSQRWVPDVSVRTTLSRSGPTPLRRGGRYLIVGGTGGVGLSIARFLAEHHEASLVLTGRNGRPVVSDATDTEAVRRTELLDEIAASAASLEVVAVDATDTEAMSSLIDGLYSDGRHLDGVIVAAGVADRAGAIHRRSRDDMTASIASKVHALVVLERALGDRELDFVLLSSSIAATLYHNRFAQVGYVTGNAFAEAFALRSRQRGRPMTTVAWDDWLDVGMSVRAARDFTADYGTEVDLVDKANSFSPAEGVELFDRALRTGEPVLLVSPTDLAQRIDDDVHVISPFLEQAMVDDAPVAAVAGATVDELVTATWSALLGYERFEPTDDFFDLGGDSLQAARMVDRLSRALGADVPVDVVFDNPRFDGLVEVLEQLEAKAAPAETPESAEPDGATGPVPLGPAQRRFLDRGSERPHHFNVSVLLRPNQRLAVDDVRAALEAAVAGHVALRLSLTADSDGEMVQVVGPLPDELLTVVELASLDPAEAAARLRQSAADLQQSLDLQNGPAFRSALYDLPGGEQRLLLTIHHLMSDRVSLLLLLDAIDAGLRNPTAADTHPQRHIGASYLDWVQAQVDAVNGNHDEMSRRWIDRLWNRVAPLPLDHDGGADLNRNSHADAVETTLPDEQLAEAAERTGARPEEIVLLALAEAVGDWSNGGAALIDVLGHGRRLPLDVDVSRSVGMFITYSPVLVDRQAGTWAKIDGMRSDLADGWSFDALRFYGPPEIAAQLGERPRAQVLFNYVGRSIAASGDALLVTTDDPHGPEVDPDGRRDHLIAVRADTIDDGRLKLTFVYSTALHDRSTIERLAARTVDEVDKFNRPDRSGFLARQGRTQEN